MHEVSIMGQIFEIIEETMQLHLLNKVSKVVLRVGEMASVEEHSLRFAFEALGKDTPVMGAQLIINRVKATARCPKCHRVFEVSYHDKHCPTCQHFSNEIVTGYELQIDQVEGE